MHNGDDNLQEMVVGRLDDHMWKSKIGPLSHAILKINTKLFKALHLRLQIVKLVERNGETSVSWIRLYKYRLQ